MYSMEQQHKSPVKKQRVDCYRSTQEQASAAHEWTGNAAVISNVVHFLPTGQDVLCCELVNSTWRSSAMCPALPLMHLTTQALNKTCPPCLLRNARRLTSLCAAFIIEHVETNMRHRDEIRASNRAAVEVLAASASNLASLVIEGVGRDLQDSVWSRLTSLTRLELHNSAANNPPASLGTLTGLQHLSINNFTQLRSLAHLDETTATERHWVQQLTQLTTLSVTLTNIFRAIGGPLPASLQELELDHNPAFEYMTDNAAALTDLRSFTISGRITQLPAGMGSLPQLSRLCFSKCDRLSQLPGNLGQSASVKTVSVICNTLNRDSDLHEGMGTKPPGYLEKGGVQGMPALASLAISLPRCSCLHNGLAPTASISCLTSLNIHYSPVLRSGGEHGLEGYLAGLTALRSLQLSGIASVESLEAVAALTALTSLSIAGAEGLTGLPSFEQLGLLQRLVLKGCGKVKTLSGVQGLISLQHLTLQDMMSLGSLPIELGSLTRLQEFIVYFCPCVRKLPASLQQLQLRLLSIGSLNERCPVARKLVASAKQRGAYRYPTEMGLAGGAVLGGYGMLGGAL